MDWRRPSYAGCWSNERWEAAIRRILIFPKIGHKNSSLTVFYFVNSTFRSYLMSSSLYVVSSQRTNFYFLSFLSTELEKRSVGVDLSFYKS